LGDAELAEAGVAGQRGGEVSEDILVRGSNPEVW